MALILPEISLLKVLEGLLKWIKYDYEDRLAEEEVEKSYLYRLFGGVEYNGFNYFEQAKELLTRDDLDQRKMGVRVFFDQSRAHLPTVHITLPGETEDLNGLGYNYDGEKFERKFSSRYSLIVTSDNYSEVIIIYYTIKALLTSGFMSLEEFGLRNIKIGGGDLQLNQDIVPQNVFYRGVFIDFFYEDCIPSMEYDPDDMVRGVYLQGRLIETSGDIPPIPPPTPEFRLLHNRLDEESRKLIGQHPGEAISLDPSGFSKNLGEGVDTVQKLATAVDELEASPVVTDPLTPSNDAVVVGDGFQDIASKVAGLQLVQDLKINELGNISGNVSVDLTLGSYVTATLTDSVVLAFTELPANGSVREFILAFTNIHPITYPVGTKFTGGIAPTIIASPCEIYCMIDSTGVLTVKGLIDDINTPA